MARAARTGLKATEAGRLEIPLAAPGLTPMLRAGVGGLAASLRSIRREQAPRASWPSPIDLDGGQALVEPQRIVIEWSAGHLESVVQDLLARSFRIKKPGLVFVSAMFDQEPHPTLMAVAQRALKRTFLQHGKYTTKVEKAGGPRVQSGEVDGRAFHGGVHPLLRLHPPEGHRRHVKAVTRGTSSLQAGRIREPPNATSSFRTLGGPTRRRAPSQESSPSPARSSFWLPAPLGPQSSCRCPRTGGVRSFAAPDHSEAGVRVLRGERRGRGIGRGVGATCRSDGGVAWLRGGPRRLDGRGALGQQAEVQGCHADRERCAARRRWTPTTRWLVTSLPAS